MAGNQGWMLIIWLCAVVLVLSLFEVGAILIQDLSGDQWKITNANGSISVPGQVPGSVHTALMKAGLLSDPYYRFNDDAYRWVALDNWTYAYHFNVLDPLKAKRNVKLVCEGLDTVANVTLNGVLIGMSTNMFVRHIWDIKQVIKAQQNTLQVSFLSPIAYAAREAASYPYDVPPDCPLPIQHGFCHPNFIRKEQSSFSWDWGPGFAPTGIWKILYIEAYDNPILRDAMAIPYQGGTPVYWWLNITTFFDLGNANPRQTFTGIVSVYLAKLNFTEQFQVTITKDYMQKSFQISVPKAETWWPNGHGQQPVYNLTVTLQVDKSIETSQWSGQIGFRKVELVQEKIENSSGLSFYFKINEKPIFMKGSNWIPADAFQERVDASILTKLLQDTVDANMNVLRVWGGGVYEQEMFYDICDRLGIMVWQDFMFGCAMYPTHQDFLNSVHDEVTYQVRRLASHPSIIAWSANNENEKALRENWYGTQTNFTQYASDYVSLYIGVIWEKFVSMATGLPFMSSSPSNGIETQRQGWIAEDPTSVYYGDIHFYNYDADCWNISTYKNPRFSSEYGFQSWPSLQTLQNISEPSDWSYDSAFSNHRQHHTSGQMQMLTQIQKHFNLPSSSDPLVYFKDLIFLTQISQALCIKFETEHYRRLQSILIGGEGHCMGALYWQLNDIWQAPSWSSIEYGGKWKMLHYYAKDFFTPILASGMVQDGRLYGYSVTDTTTLTDANYVTSVWSWADTKPRYQTSTKFSQDAPSSQLVINTTLADLLAKAGCSSDHTPKAVPPEYSCFITMVIQDRGSAQLSPVNPVFLASFQDVVGLKRANITITYIGKVPDDTNSYKVVLKSDGIAPFTWLDTGTIKGHFSQNGFLMMESPITVTFVADQVTSVAELAKSLKVRSLMNIY